RAGGARGGVRAAPHPPSREAPGVGGAPAGRWKTEKGSPEPGGAFFEWRGRPPPPPRRRSLTGSSGSSRSSLHAKTFAIDQSRIFVGSFNFDPRSARLNTELGFVIDSPTLARQLAEAFREGIPKRAYGVRLNASSRLAWTH